MSKADIPFAGLFLFFFGIYSFYEGFKYLKQKRLIENTPASKIRSLAMGLVEVAGEAVPAKGKTFKSPFSGNDCVWCRHTVEEFRREGKHSKWVEVEAGTDSAEFFVQDDTGEVLVDPHGAEIEIPIDFEASSGWGKEPPEMVKSFLAKKQMSYAGLLMNKTMRYREYFIAPHDKIYVMGTAGDNPFVAEGSATEGHKDIMIQKGKGNIYYISDRPEKEILKSLGWKSIAGVLGGGALTLAGLAMLLYFFGMFG